MERDERRETASAGKTDGRATSEVWQETPETCRDGQTNLHLRLFLFAQKRIRQNSGCVLKCVRPEVFQFWQNKRAEAGCSWRRSTCGANLWILPSTATSPSKKTTVVIQLLRFVFRWRRKPGSNPRPFSSVRPWYGTLITVKVKLIILDLFRLEIQKDGIPLCPVCLLRPSC